MTISQCKGHAEAHPTESCVIFEFRACETASVRRDLSPASSKTRDSAPQLDETRGDVCASLEIPRDPEIPNLGSQLSRDPEIPNLGSQLSHNALDALGELAGSSLDAIAAAAKISRAYLQKLEHGVVDSPSPRVLIAKRKAAKARD